jgi:PRTRC genetic system protein C
MALQVQDTTRKFTFKQKSGELALEDPSPAMTPAQVMDFYASAYPELTTAKVEGPVSETAPDGSSVAAYTFSTSIGTKG